MVICDLRPDAETSIVQAAQLLVEGFREHWPNAWPTLEAALDEVRECLSAERICRIAMLEETVVGWIGGIPQYDGHVWELHPLVVRADARGCGIGRALVEDLEAQVAVRGGHTIAIAAADARLQANAHTTITLPDADPLFTPLLATLPLQLLSYYLGVARGYDPDFPRNLSKTLTVD